MEYYMDEKKKLSRNYDSNTYNYGSTSSSKSSLMRSISTKSSTSKSSLPRSFSHKSSLFSRSSSQKCSSNSKSTLERSSSQKCAKFTRKCGNLAKEQKAKFYIVKRCITMLVFWNKHGDS